MKEEAGRNIDRREAIGRVARVGAGAYALGTIPLLARCAPALGREPTRFTESAHDPDGRLDRGAGHVS